MIIQTNKQRNKQTKTQKNLWDGEKNPKKVHSNLYKLEALVTVV